MASFKQTQIKPGVTKHRSTAVKVYVDQNIAVNDILSVTGVQGDFMKVAKADANGVVTLNDSLLYIADYAAADGSYTPVALPWKVVVGVNTSASAIGAPVFLSDTAGGFSFTTGSHKVGTVLTVATAANDGTILFAPQSLAATSGSAIGASTSLIQGAGDVDFTITQPAGSVLTDVGIVMTTALAGSSGDVVVSVGTSVGGEQICADTNWMSGHGDIPIGTSLQVASGSQGEGAASLTFVTDSAVLYTAGTSRVIHIQVTNSANVSAGIARPYIKFERL
tara:strand:+ start:2030 stop:2866 length:837 start_codon:yes stop_codon:yes gene_type:complete